MAEPLSRSADIHGAFIPVERKIRVEIRVRKAENLVVVLRISPEGP